MTVGKETITSLSVSDLKKIAKHHNLPRYSTMTKTDLIVALTDRGIALERLPEKSQTEKTLHQRLVGQRRQKTVRELRQIVKHLPGYYRGMNKQHMLALLETKRVQSAHDPQNKTVPGNLPPELIYAILRSLTPTQTKTAAAVSMSVKHVRDLYVYRDLFLIGLYEWIQKDAQSSLFPSMDRTIQINFLHKNQILIINLDKHYGSNSDLDITVSYKGDSVRFKLPKNDLIPLLNFVARIFILFRGGLHRSSKKMFKQYTPTMMTILQRQPHFLQHILEPRLSQFSPRATQSYKKFTKIYETIDSTFLK